ncbi:hypothetical protein EG827_04510 [bacterium]|nr:hypothetical protein [bacterium]
MNTRKTLFGNLLVLALIVNPVIRAQETQDRWALASGNSISWTPGNRLPHNDHIEMSGRHISAVIRYGVSSDGAFTIRRDIVWPMLRTLPNDTHASLTRSFSIDPARLITVSKRPLQSEKVEEVILDGTIVVKSAINDNLKLVRTLFPSTTLPLFGEKYVLVSTGSRPVTVEIPEVDIITRTRPEEGLEGSYTLRSKTINYGTYLLSPGDSVTWYYSITGNKNAEDIIDPDIEDELLKRKKLVSLFAESLILDTPDEVLNRAFAFAKIRAAESIYQTRGGPMHGPGGLSYYAAIWANDQAEYINPFFPSLGYDYGIESAINSYRHFARFMNPDYRPIPSSIIAEGSDVWNGAGDRGDAAMIAYGASRFALWLGDREVAEELWSLIQWCLEYNRRMLNPEGVVRSDSDELEGRFPAGTANLCTSSLYYDALLSATWLGASLGKDRKQLSGYNSRARELKENIEKYFGADVMGFRTYRYYAGNDTLRAWICIPLTVGIFERKEETINALFSPALWTSDGLASLAGDKTFWDRATLYALRGVFSAGDVERGLKFLQNYSRRRLLGDHVPYPVEAYPEGGQRHLSAESGLYCRIFTEGLFGIRPVGLTSFRMTPRLPEKWNYMRIKNMHGFNEKFDIDVTRESDRVRVQITSGGRVVINKLIVNGTTLTVEF